MPRSSITAFAVSLALLALSACGQRDTTGNATPVDAAAPPPAVAAPAAPAPAVTAPAAGDDAILAAAEPFEKLTETSFSATPAVLDGTIAEVQSAAAGLKGILSPDADSRLRVRLDEIAAARKADNRADLAIAAVEGYRVLVSAVSASAKVPTAVNLLDYAGFRYDAGLKSTPARWDDMTQAVAFGREQWASIAPQVSDAALRARMEAALADMATAATDRDADASSSAAQRELALVDDLEKFFSR